MSSVLDPSELEQSPLADLHLLADELGIDGFRRLRKADLIDAIIARQSGAEPAEAEADAEPQAATEADADAEADAKIAADADAEPQAAADVEADADAKADAGAEPDAEERGRSRRGRRGGRGRSRGRDEDADDARDDEPEASRGDAEDRVVEGVVELLANGSGFVRLAPPEATDDDVYVSAAQVKRCELVSGDRVGGPVRSPRRSERFPSMIRIDTINGRPADEVAEGTRFDDLPVAFASEHLELASDDPTLKAISWLTPFGKGSRVSIVGAPRAGKSEALRRLAAVLADREGVELTAVLAGVRPEEVAEWQGGAIAPAAAVSFAASADAQVQAVEQAIEQGRRVAARGGDAVVVIDTLEYLPAGPARRALAAARNIVDGGSLTVIATAPEPLGGETTVVALDAGLAAMSRFPALDLARSGTLRPELLVGDAGAGAIALARAEQAATQTG
jgi:transcription termination factor Rho